MLDIIVISLCTFGQVVFMLDPDHFAACSTQWVNWVSEVVQGEVVAIDGETLRGCHDRNGRGALHLISPGRRRTGWCWGTTGIPALLQRGGVWSPLTPWGVNYDEGRVTLDPIDELQRSCELKVSAGAEPAQITMAGAEVRRARTTPDFSVVVISGIGGIDARPRVRVIVDPLSQLQLTESGSITLSGLHSAPRLTYDFPPNDVTAQASEEDEMGVSAE